MKPRFIQYPFFYFFKKSSYCNQLFFFFFLENRIENQIYIEPKLEPHKSFHGIFIYLSKEFEHIQWCSYFSNLTILNLVGLLLWIDLDVISFSFSFLFWFSNFYIFNENIKIK